MTEFRNEVSKPMECCSHCSMAVLDVKCAQFLVVDAEDEAAFVWICEPCLRDALAAIKLDKA